VQFLATQLLLLKIGRERPIWNLNIFVESIHGQILQPNLLHRNGLKKFFLLLNRKKKICSLELEKKQFF